MRPGGGFSFQTWRLPAEGFAPRGVCSALQPQSIYNKNMRRIFDFFDRFEDRVRARLSHYPIWYAIIGGFGIVLFWRGVWLTADYVVEIVAASHSAASTINPPTLLWWDGPLSLLIGLLVLLATGVFVSNFIGNEIIITGLRGDKKLTERAESEVRHEVGAIGEIRREVKKIAEQLEQLESKKK